ncbi:hypothetical protein KKG82_05305 [Patescibacteria group bacterium]|nr:hypothetical protein [Patescibacteria group bacterium]
MISVADQYEHGEADDNRIVKKLDQLKSTVEDLILRRKKDKEVTHILADKMMEERLSALLN